MLKTIAKGTVWSLFFVAFVAILYGFSSIYKLPSYKTCICEYKKYIKANSQLENSGFINAFIGDDKITCYFRFFDRHNGSVTAIATIFICVFTFLLVSVTVKQSRITFSTQRPWVGIHAVGVLGQSRALILQPNISQPAPRIIIKNSGNVFATSVRTHIYGNISEEVPEVPTIPQDAIQNVIIPGGEDHQIPFETDLLVFTQEQITAINNGTLKVWIVGRIEYGDTIGGLHYTTVRLVYNVRGGGFGAHGKDDNKAT